MNPRLTILCILFGLIGYSLLSSCITYSSLSDAQQNPDKVYNLKISYQKLDSLPPEILQLKNLRRLYLFKTQLTHLPDAIGNLENLETLIISSNRLKELPSSIGKLKNLKKLSLNHNHLSQLPEELWELKNLKELYLQHNFIESISPDISKLQMLENLSINNNRIAYLPDQIGDLRGLMELDVSFCGSQVQLPETIKNCLILETLVVDDTQIVPYVVRIMNRRMRIIVRNYSSLNRPL